MQDTTTSAQPTTSPHHYNPQIIALIKQKLYPLRIKHQTSLKLPSIHRHASMSGIHSKYVQVEVNESSVREHTELEEEHQQRKRLKSPRASPKKGASPVKSHPHAPIATDIALLKHCQSLLALNHLITAEHPPKDGEKLITVVEEETQIKPHTPLNQQRRQHADTLARIGKEILSKKKDFMSDITRREEFSKAIQQNKYSLDYLVSHLSQKQPGQETPSVPFQELSPNKLPQFIDMLEGKQQRRSVRDEGMTVAINQPGRKKRSRQEEMKCSNSMYVESEEEQTRNNAISARLRLKANHKKLIVLGRGPE